MNATVVAVAAMWLVSFVLWVCTLSSGVVDATGEAVATLILLIYTAMWMWWCYPEDNSTPFSSSTPQPEDPSDPSASLRILQRFVPALPRGICEVCAEAGNILAGNEGHDSVIVAQPCMHFSHKRCFDCHNAAHFAAAGEKDPCRATCPSCKVRITGYTCYTTGSEEGQAKYSVVSTTDR